MLLINYDLYIDDTYEFKSIYDFNKNDGEGIVSGVTRYSIFRFGLSRLYDTYKKKYFKNYNKFNYYNQPIYDISYYDIYYFKGYCIKNTPMGYENDYSYIYFEDIIIDDITVKLCKNEIELKDYPFIVKELKTVHIRTKKEINFKIYCIPKSYYYMLDHEEIQEYKTYDYILKASRYINFRSKRNKIILGFNIYLNYKNFKNIEDYNEINNYNINKHKNYKKDLHAEIIENKIKQIYSPDNIKKYVELYGIEFFQDKMYEKYGL